MKLTLIALCLVTLASAASAQVQRVPSPRTALLMGVDAYTDPVFPALPAKGIERDLDSMKGALEVLGFTVTVVRNPTPSAAKAAVDRFGETIKARGGTSLFYFSGHGAEHEGKNYLIPIGTNVIDPADINDEGLVANRVLARMESAGTTVNLLFLDCCRNALTKAGGDTGLAPMSAKGALIGFATRSGDIAATTERGSPYTTALAARLTTRAMSLPDVHSLVTQDLALAGQKQRPGFSSDLGGIFQFFPNKAGAAETLALIEPPRSEGLWPKSLSEYLALARKITVSSPPYKTKSLGGDYAINNKELGSYWDDEGIQGKPSIVVDISDQQAIFMLGDKVVGTAAAMTGAPDTPTPRGTFVVTDKLSKAEDPRYGYLIKGNGSTEGTPFDAVTETIPQNSRFEPAEIRSVLFLGKMTSTDIISLHEGYVTGSPGTKGDIRLSKEVVLKFFDRAVVGTEVTIRE